ncbi:MAG: M1 family aminopeptidase [Candidatus Hydrogenedentes bacterium]|nr:M1 family aminopeptidase [Candidatus Hydrogenedentota bacterium]
MRSFLDVVKFEIRYQLMTPFLWVALLIFGLLHFCTVTSIGIHLDQNQRIDINGVAKILQVVSTLNYLAMLPVVVFVATAITRDYERSLASFFFVTPVGKLPFLLGRFTAVFSLSLLAGLAGLLGTCVGTYMPWLDSDRIGAYTWGPYGFALLAIILPNQFIMCALFFTAAALTRSISMIVAAATAIIALDLVLVLYTGLDNIGSAAIADPFAALTIIEDTRYWTVPELNARLPAGMLLENRLLWLGIACFALVFTFRRFRLDLEERGGASRNRFSRRNATKSAATTLPPRRLEVETSFRLRDSLAQFASQLKMDAASVLKNRFTPILLILVAVTTMQDAANHTEPLGGLPYYPVTSLMLEHFRFGLLSFVMIAAIYYSGALVYCEREAGLSEIVDASAYADWIMVASKTAALCVLVSALLVTAMIVTIVSQALAGYTNFELALFVNNLIIHNGFYFAMLCVLAVLIQVLAPNKWLGTLWVFVVLIGLMSLEEFGVEHIMVLYKIPYALHSEMNGYGPAGAQILPLIAYWSPFCVLLILLGHLTYPRGLHASMRKRFRDARFRINSSIAAIVLIASFAFLTAGAWIFYNTNILNQYQTTEQHLQLLAEYERKYAQYQKSPSPSFKQIDMQVDIYPEERRLESRGAAVLRNNKDHAIHQFVVSVDPRMAVKRLDVSSATLKTSDPQLGFYLLALTPPLEPGGTVALDWELQRANRGFVNSNHDYRVVANGTYIPNGVTIPIPGFDAERFITDDAWRKRRGLNPAAGLPDMGDPDSIGILKFGVDGRCDFRAVVSTSADQIAVTQGELHREWLKDGRRYFEYVAERPIWPAVSFASARYEVARDAWNDVNLEIYHDEKHGQNIDAMLKTIKLTLDYQTREFAPYPHKTFRIVEHPRYDEAAKSPSGTADYPEVLGFLTDNSGWNGLDFATVHELSHQWWGGLAYGARMRGRQMLNESLAQYSTLMIFKERFGDHVAGRVARSFQDLYLRSRSAETGVEHPLIHTDDQGYISYGKGPLAFYALQDAIGENRVNLALRSYLDKFAFQEPPFPTSRDVVNELRAVADEEHQPLITDLFEKIVLYEFRVDKVDVEQSGDVYDVSIAIAAWKFEADGLGQETEVPLSANVDVAIFSHPFDHDGNRQPFVLNKHHVITGVQTITLQVAKPPAAVVIDPWYKLIDRTPKNNSMKIEF